jgi:RNA polymerase sigma-70 factor (ECF subfamily)
MIGESPDDSALLRAVARRDEPAFRTLYRRHTPRVYGLVRRLLGAGAADADDVVQETWLRAVKALSAFRGESMFSTWLCGIATRCALEALRRRTASGEFTEPVAPAQSMEMAIDLERAIAALPDGCRTVLVLHDLEGRTHGEIAHLLGVAEGTSKSQLSRARRAVRASLRFTHGASE